MDRAGFYRIKVKLYKRPNHQPGNQQTHEPARKRQRPFGLLTLAFHPCAHPDQSPLPTSVLIERQEITTSDQKIDPAEHGTVRHDTGDQVKNDSREVHTNLMWY